MSLGGLCPSLSECISVLLYPFSRDDCVGVTPTLFLFPVSFCLLWVCVRVCICARLLVMKGGSGCLFFLGVPVHPRVHLWPHPSAGFLIVLSMALFVIQCETLRPKPQVSYLPITYLCWGAGALMLWAGESRASEGPGAEGGGPERTRDRAWGHLGPSGRGWGRSA